MSGVFDPVLNTPDSTYTDCSAQADSQTQPIDDLSYHVGQTWQPTGYFSPDSIRQVVAKQLEVVRQSQNAIDAAMSSATTDQVDLLKSAQDNLFADGQQANNYLAAANTADSAGTGIVYAPNLKSWVTLTLTHSSSASHAASVVRCMEPSWIVALQAIIGVCTEFANLVMSIPGLALDAVQTAVQAGQAVVKSVEAGVGFLAWVTTHLPWILGGVVILAVGLLVFKHRDKIRDTFQTPGHLFGDWGN